MKTLNLIALQRNLKRTADCEPQASGLDSLVPALGPGNSDAQYNGVVTVSSSADQQPAPVNEQLRNLAEAVKQYRHYQKLYFAKLKRNEFAKDEQHFMMKYQDKIDKLLSIIQL